MIDSARIGAFLTICVALLLAACGGNGGGSLIAPQVNSSPSGSATPTTTPIAYCTSVAPPTLAYPANNATGIPDGNFQLAVTYSENPGNAFTTPSLTSGSTSVAGGAWTAGSASQWTSAIPTLAAHTAYTITVTNPQCSQTFTLGTFTTQ
jgi:hypothetical protein